MMVINNIELEIDLMDIDTKEHFNDCFLIAEKKIQKAQDETVNNAVDIEYMRKYCQAIIDFFDDVFGDGTSNAIFEGRANMRKCMLALKEVLKEKIRQDNELVQIMKDSTALILEETSTQSEELPQTNRAQRRALAKRKN